MNIRTFVIGLPFCLMVAPVFATSLSDPTSPLNAPESEAVEIETSDDSAPDQFRLQQILLGKGRALAVINGKSFAIGDRVGVYILTEIHPYRVKLKNVGDTKELTILISNIKTKR